jgi:hypothetical protein
MPTPDNFMELPEELFVRMLAAIETPDDLSEREVTELIEDANEWYPMNHPKHVIVGRTEDDHE